MLPVISKEGFGPFREAYYRAWVHTGQVVRVQDEGKGGGGGGGGSGGGLREVRIVGLADNGYLSAVGDDGMFELSPDGNSLDFLQGLIAKKV